VNSGSPLNEVVLFEIAGFEAATELSARLAMDWFAWVQSYEELRFVAVMLVPDGGDLATLLRSVQRWLSDRGGGPIRFELDGRLYTLDAAAPASVAA
jgi:hypothetical protein